jgi:hypothetical protein
MVVDFPNEPTTATMRASRTKVDRYKLARRKSIGQERIYNAVRS